jgi:hypothetical protein
MVVRNIKLVNEMILFFRSLRLPALTAIHWLRGLVSRDLFQRRVKAFFGFVTF